MNESGQSRIASCLYLVLGLVLVGGIGYGIFETIRSSPSVAGPLVTALGAVGAVLIGRHWEQRQQIEQARRERVSVAYTTLVEAFFKAAESGGMEPDRVAKTMSEVVQTVLLWGPPSVIGEFNAWRAVVAEEENPLTGLLPFERLMRAMRADLGSKNEDLAMGDLLRLVVNDFDEHLSRAIEKV